MKRFEYIGIVLILAFLAAALTYQAKHIGLTIDETSHFAAAYMYWLGEDVLEPSDTPPLTRAICGWVPLVLHAPDPHLSTRWAGRNAYDIGQEILGRPFIRARRLLFYTRLPFVIFPLFIVFLVWQWSRQLFDGWVALTLAACAALEPTLLGHAPLIASDVASACMALWFAYAAWRYWRNPKPQTLLLLTAALTAAMLTKFTLMPLAVFGYVLALWRGPRLMAAFLIPGAIYASLLAAYQFTAEPVSELLTGRFWAAGVPERAIPLANLVARLPWPPQFIKGLIFVGTSVHEDHFPGYMLGRVVHGWTPGYFPLCWAIKFPIPLQFLALAGLAVFLINIRSRKVSAAEVLVWGGALFFFGTATFSNYHIGFRHVMPSLPFFILGGGLALERWGGTRVGRRVITVGLVWLAVSSLRLFPQEISYFNEWIGSPRNGWKYLADSNVDWGQNLPELGLYIVRHHVEELHTFLFTLDSPFHYIREGVLSPIEWPAENVPAGTRYTPGPGTYAISVDVLTGVVASPGREDYMAAFRRLSPIGRAGYSIFVYEVK